MIYIIELKKRIEVEAEDSGVAVEYAIGAEKALPLWQIKVKQEEKTQSLNHLGLERES